MDILVDFAEQDPATGSNNSTTVNCDLNPQTLPIDYFDFCARQYPACEAMPQ